MWVTVVQVRVVRVTVALRLVLVPVRMRFGHRAFVPVLMVIVMHVTVIMLQYPVRMLMVMPFTDMEPRSYRHQDARGDDLNGWFFAQRKNSEDSTDEWGECKVGSSPGRSKMAQRQHKEYQADAHAEKPDDRTGANQSWRRNRRSKRQRQRAVGHSCT